jgi:hypothetical protein
VAPLVGVARKILVAGTKFSETSMVAPLEVLAAGPTAATTGVGDVDGGPRRGCWRQVQQWPPPELEMSMAAPLRGAGGKSDSGQHQSWRRRWRAH